jgi:hypothetical protein
MIILKTLHSYLFWHVEHTSPSWGGRQNLLWIARFSWSHTKRFSWHLTFKNISTYWSQYDFFLQLEKWFNQFFVFLMSLWKRNILGNKFIAQYVIFYRCVGKVCVITFFGLVSSHVDECRLSSVCTWCAYTIWPPSPPPACMNSLLYGFDWQPSTQYTEQSDIVGTGLTFHSRNLAGGGDQAWVEMIVHILFIYCSVEWMLTYLNPPCNEWISPHDWRFVCSCCAVQ